MTRSTIFQDTIFALSSGAPPSGVAVVRISGPHAHTAARDIAGKLPILGTFAVRNLRMSTGELIDRGIVLSFAGPHSFTGEDCVEIQMHGGKAVITALLEALASMPGLRQAEAGEFARRAFLNGKLELTEVEALADLLLAETETQRRLAVANAEGAQGELYGQWRHRLLHARAMLEAELDFADESDVPGSVAGDVWKDLEGLRESILSHSEGYRAAQIIRDGFRVVIAGRPNAGKSSLLNALAQREAAIVTDVPGTTRDLVEVVLDLNGVKVILTDTAGIRESQDRVEQIGVERARRAVGSADFVIHLIEPGDNSPLDLGQTVEELVVRSKIDVMRPSACDKILGISVLTGEGVDRLLARISEAAMASAGDISTVLPSRLRHVTLLREAAVHISNAIEANAEFLELQAEELRLASRALGRIVGEIGTEDVLGVIFSEFCIGK